jgi:hypothetical protein
VDRPAAMLDTDDDTLVTTDCCDEARVVSELTADDSDDSDVDWPTLIEDAVLATFDTALSCEDTDESPFETEISELVSTTSAFDSDEIWLEIDEDSPAVICAWATPAPSHDATPGWSCDVSTTAPSAWSTTADEPSIRVAFKPRSNF